MVTIILNNVIMVVKRKMNPRTVHRKSWKKPVQFQGNRFASRMKFSLWTKGSVTVQRGNPEREQLLEDVLISVCL